MKTCCNKQCKQQNPQSIEAFSKDKSTKDGFKHKCRTCSNEIKRANYHFNPEVQKKYNIDYILLNPEKRAKTQKKYYEKLKAKRNMWEAMTR